LLYIRCELNNICEMLFLIIGRLINNLIFLQPETDPKRLEVAAVKYTF